MANLYSIQLEYALLMEMLEETEGEITEELAERLQAFEEHRSDIFDAICKQIANTESDIVAIKDEVERLNERKKSMEAHIETHKRNIIKLLKHFGMVSPNKKSSGYAFQTALFSGYTRSVTSVNVDNALLINTFAPITGEESPYVKYSISATVGHDDLKKLNELGVLPVTSYNPTVDKKSAKEYLEAIPQSHEEESESSTGFRHDPVAKIASLMTKDSLTIK